jgi:hypothetical protein
MRLNSFDIRLMAYTDYILYYKYLVFPKQYFHSKDAFKESLKIRVQLVNL